VAVKIMDDPLDELSETMGSSLTATLPLIVMVCPTKLCWVGLHSASSELQTQEVSGHLPDYLIDLSVYS